MINFVTFATVGEIDTVFKKLVPVVRRPVDYDMTILRVRDAQTKGTLVFE